MCIHGRSETDYRPLESYNYSVQRSNATMSFTGVPDDFLDNIIQYTFPESFKRLCNLSQLDLGYSDFNDHKFGDGKSGDEKVSGRNGNAIKIARDVTVRIAVVARCI
ncbi:hypothetical protein BOTCAL_0027g00310 [Botryotinia calthae]|uniref:Uncharacterized protein n=1 Tax=Botryotinia calthae TaxID=38488 RepID=A0A4Y8DG69_9HELO|nr:hypothetical protein BOTCAL_0027g00310 [Botryotinia calthae]